MPFNLKPEKFKTITNPAEVEKLMKQDAARSPDQGKAAYVAAADVPVGARKLSMFVVTDQPRSWQDVFTKLKAGKIATGECRTVSTKPFRIAIMSANGDSKANVVKRAGDALGVQAVDFAQHLAAASHAQAKKEGTSDRDYVPTNDDLRVMLTASLELAEYKKFAAAFAELAKKYDMKDVKKVPVDIWGSMLKGLRDSKYLTKEIKKADNGRDFVLAYTGADGKSVREDMLANAMNGLGKFAQHAGTYLDKVVAEVRKAGGTPTWSFWSGEGSMDAAKASNSGGVVLEGSVGAWFEKVWDFEPFAPGISSLALWTSLSELYAQKAAEYYDVFSFNGYVGRGATKDQSVFNKIEQPTFLQVLNVRKKVDAPDIAWYVVHSTDVGAPKWKWDGKAPTPASSRAEALAIIADKYGT